MSTDKLLSKRDILTTHLNKYVNNLHKLNIKHNKFKSIVSGVATTRFCTLINFYGLIAECYEQNIV